MADGYDPLPDLALLLDAALRSGWSALPYVGSLEDHLGLEASGGPEAAERLLREALKPRPECRCLLGGGTVLPFACPVHGVPCDDCGEVEYCTEACGRPRRALPDDGDWAEAGCMDDAGGEWLYVDQLHGQVRIVFSLPEHGHAARYFSKAGQEEFGRLWVSACNQAEASSGNAEEDDGPLCAGCGGPAGSAVTPIELGGVLCQTCAAEDRKRTAAAAGEDDA